MWLYCCLAEFCRMILKTGLDLGEGKVSKTHHLFSMPAMLGLWHANLHLSHRMPVQVRGGTALWQKRSLGLKDANLADLEAQRLL